MVLQAKELRIGNLVVINNGNLPEVNNRISTILGVQQRIEKDFPNSDSVICFNCDGSWVNYHQFNEYVEPIPLTGEWLFRFGFENIKYGHEKALDLTTILQLIVSNGYYSTQLIQFPEMSFLKSQVISLNSIKYVHQLQNLYFVLTGEELQMK